jgi:glycine/D-amino acid oxidase-like deaminating enzyme
MPFSIWESRFYQGHNDLVVLGGGIVGLNTAIQAKLLNNDIGITVVDRSWPVLGASTKNAGFVCFGSPSELLDDIACNNEDSMVNTFKVRWEGSELLRDVIGQEDIDYSLCGGLELYDQGSIPSDESILQLNSLLKHHLGLADYFKWIDQSEFSTFDEKAIIIPGEGRIDAMRMMDALYRRAQEVGVKFIFRPVLRLEVDTKELIFDDGSRMKFKSIACCTNGFTRSFLPDLDIQAVRNLVLVTNELPNIQWDKVVHYDQGYVYFRRVGQRILIGGARNHFREEETTDQFGENPEVRQYLTSFLEERLLLDKIFNIEFEWSGILGVGESKKPIIKEVQKDIFVAARMGGMGVAIGAHVGRELAILITGKD